MHLPPLSEVASWLSAFVGSERKKRVPILGPDRCAMGAMADTFPQCRGNPGAPVLLRQAIGALESAGEIRLPKGRAHYDSFYGALDMPRMVTRVDGREPERREAQVVWHPRLAGAAALRGTQIEAATAVNSYLIGKPAGLLPVVPAKERSLMIFGSDKALQEGFALPLEDRPISAAELGARRVEPFLCHEGFPEAAGRGVGLVVENPTTYETLLGWNLRTRRYAAMVLGEGARICASPARLEAISAKHGLQRWEYFGDIDCEGMRIAGSVASQMAERGVDVVPAAGAYRWLARHGRMVPSRYVSKEDRDVSVWPTIRPLAARWLGEEAVLAAVDRTVEARSYIPQEWMGMDVVAGGESLDDSLPPPPVRPALVESMDIEAGR